MAMRVLCDPQSLKGSLQDSITLVEESGGYFEIDSTFSNSFKAELEGGKNLTLKEDMQIKSQCLQYSGTPCPRDVGAPTETIPLSMEAGAPMQSLPGAIQSIPKTATQTDGSIVQETVHPLSKVHRLEEKAREKEVYASIHACIAVYLQQIADKNNLNVGSETQHFSTIARHMQPIDTHTQVAPDDLDTLDIFKKIDPLWDTMVWGGNKNLGDTSPFAALSSGYHASQKDGDSGEKPLVFKERLQDTREMFSMQKEHRMTSCQEASPNPRKSKEQEEGQAEAIAPSHVPLYTQDFLKFPTIGSTTSSFLYEKMQQAAVPMMVTIHKYPQETLVTMRFFHHTHGSIVAAVTGMKEGVHIKFQAGTSLKARLQETEETLREEWASQGFVHHVLWVSYEKES